MPSAITIAFLIAALPAFAHAQEISSQPRTGQPLAGLSQEQLDRFMAGKNDFSGIFEPEDGLGPIFNKDSCGGCHNAGGVGGSGNISVTRFGFLAKDGFDPLDSLGGSLRQSEAIDDDCAEVVPDEANVETERITTSTFGAGLIEAIADADLEALASDGPGVSGRVHWVPALEDPTDGLHAGRFGWKAQVATVMTFSADASLNEMGLTNRFLGAENAPNGDATRLSECDSVEDPELVADDAGFDFLDRITDFQRLLAAPPQTPKSGTSGEQVFIDIGCADCHRAEAFTTRDDVEEPLAGVEIKPYSDFLLHDMASLGDLIAQGDASTAEIKTPPLWGVRFRSPLLHDGSASSSVLAERLDAAIVAHEGEAEPARDAYLALGDKDAERLLLFLGSLGRAEFDMDGNNFLDERDFEEFLSCYREAGIYDADQPCAVADIDQDQDVDADDFASFLAAYDDELADCDGDGTADLEQILFGAVTDCDGNLVPDTCDPDANGNGVPEVCETFLRGDADLDGQVNIVDPVFLLRYLFLAGAVPGCLDSCDSDDDGELGLVDAVQVLRFLFLGGGVVLTPYPQCGLDPDPVDALDCGEPCS